MRKFVISLVDRQTKKPTTVLIEANSHQEAKAIAMRDYSVAYIVK